MAKMEQEDVGQQSWPVYADILSSTLIVLAFALLVMVMVVSVMRVTSSIRNESFETAPSSYKVESEVLGDYRAEFQKLAIVANPSMREEMQIQSDAPTVDQMSNRPIYVPKDIIDVVDKPQEVKAIGDSERQVLGDMPKVVDVNPIEVLEELIIVQRDVIEQQRKVIEQQDEQINQTVREYQSLLALVTNEKEIEDVRQKINPQPDQAKFMNLDANDQRISGTEETPQGQGSLFLSPPNNPTSTIAAEVLNDALFFNFKDNAPFLNNDSEQIARNTIVNNKDKFDGNIVLETKITDFAVSGAEAQRIAVERLLIFRSLLIDAGISPDQIRMRTIEGQSGNPAASNSGQSGSAELNYGWVVIKRNG
jgi:DNA-binding protein H-NS